MSVVFLRLVSLQMGRNSPQEVGQETSGFGISLVVLKWHTSKVCRLFVSENRRYIKLFNCKGHTDRVGGVACHPNATISQSPDAINLASGAGDKRVFLWSLAVKVTTY